ncbi:MAG TPA: hypothetical protein VEI97_12220 [bacterium]|nr:hypothetical protein [bacterium]
MRREYWYMLAAALVGLPALYAQFTHMHLYETAPVTGIFLFGAAIVGAAFLLTWGAELAELEMSPNLALVVLALVAVLPEYAVDIYLAYTAGTFTPTEAEPVNKYQALALANMTGANRILIGIGWPVVAIISWFRFGRSAIQLELARSADIFWLGAATLYSFLIPIKQTITVVDTVILLALYGTYLWTCSRVPSRESHLVGPAALVGMLPRRPRVIATWAFFLWAGVVIYISSHPFAESLIAAGQSLGIDEFLLVQWLAPLASESPEFLAVILLTLKGAATDGMGALVSSKVNQWSLLVGMVPLAYAIGHMRQHGAWEGGFRLDPRQTEELILTSAQSIFAIASIMSYRFRLRDAWLLLGLFFLQLIVTIALEEQAKVTNDHRPITTWHYMVSVLYVVIAVFHFIEYRRFIPAIFRGAFYLDAKTYGQVMTGVHAADLGTKAEAGPEAIPAPTETMPADEPLPGVAPPPVEEPSDEELPEVTTEGHGPEPR